MRQFQIEIVNVTPPVFIKTVKGGYNVLEVAFKQDGRVGGKKFMDFAAPGVYNLLETAKAGDIFDVVSEKNAKGYIDWVSVNPGTAAEAGPEVAQADSGASSPVAAKPGYTGKGRVVGSTYETAEERATKQAAIIRQATLNAAIEFHRGELNTAQGPDEFESVLATARQFETYTYSNLQARAESLRAVVDGLKKTS